MFNFKTKLAAAGTAVLGFVSSAHAALPASVSTSITDVGTDAATIGGLVLVVIVGIAGFKYLRKAL